MRTTRLNGRVAIAALALCLALPTSAQAQGAGGNGGGSGGKEGGKTTPNGPPGTPAGTNFDPDSNCINGYVWSNVTPSGKLGPDGYARRVNDGKPYCIPRFFLMPY